MLLATLILIGVLLVAAYKKRYSKVENVNQGVVIFDDFLTSSAQDANGNAQGLYFYAEDSGVGASVSGSFLGLGYPGIRVLTAFQPDAYSRLYSANGLSFICGGGNVLDAQARGNINISSLDGQAYFSSFGISNTLSVVPDFPPTLAAYFKVDTSISNNWLCVTVSPSAPESVKVTDVLAVNAGDTYLRVNVSGSGCFFWINNKLVLSAPPLPTGPVSVGAAVKKLSGNITHSCQFSMDAISVSQQLATPRQFVNPQSQG